MIGGRTGFAGTIGGLLEARAAEAGRPFLTAAGTTWSYVQVAERAARLAAGLRKLGVGSGDKVCLFLPNRAEFVLGLFAAARVGAVFVPAHHQLTASELAYVLHHSDARVALTDPEHLPILREARPWCPSLRAIMTSGPADGEAIPLADLLALPPAPAGPVGPDDPAAILYTSGTTGRPKGAVLLHRGYRLNAEAFRDRVGLRADDVLLCVLPLAHVNAQRSSVLAAAAAGARVVVEPFHGSTFWETARREGATFASLLPTVLSILLRQAPGPADRRHSMRLCVSPATEALAAEFEARFGVPVVTTYGSTEGMLNIMGFADPAANRAGPVGKPIAPEVHEVRIVDEAGREVPRGSEGEIVQRSPALMREYYKDPEATARALRDGWLHTGDLGRMDADGFVYFVGRKKELIRRGGENVSPAEVEAALAAHPRVAEVAVVGVPDPIYEEEIKAFVLLRPGETPATVPPAELFAHCATRLAPYKVPRYLEYREEFPRTPTWRVQKRRLASGEAGPPGPTFDRLAHND
jgi:acyl-CoA synthetase (AMP-forming)/AMP-acid ligase II